MAVQARQVYAPRWQSHSSQVPVQRAAQAREEDCRSRDRHWSPIEGRSAIREPALALIASMAGGMATAIARRPKAQQQRWRRRNHRVHMAADGHDRLASCVSEEAPLSSGVDMSEEEEQPGKELLNIYTAPVVLLVLAALYGANVPLLKMIESQTQALVGVTGPELLALRFLSACIVCVPWLACNVDKVQAALKPGFELAVWLWLGYTGQLLALGKTSVALTAICTSLVGVTVQGLEVCLEKQPVRPMVAVSSIGVILGLATFAYIPEAPPSGDPSPLSQLCHWLFSLGRPEPVLLPHEVLLSGIPGEAIAVAGAFFFGVHVWRCNRVIADAPKGMAGGDFELALAIVQLFVMTLLSLGFSWLDNPLTFSEQVMSLGGLDRDMWIQIAACGIVCTGLPAVVELFAFKVVPPAVAALIYCTIPLWGAGLGIVVLKEPWHLQTLVGALLILVSSLMPSLSGLSEPLKVSSNSDALMMPTVTVAVTSGEEGGQLEI
mmetsp:Transcript_16784/g.38877  ORF Transcript_16784/g.38877 Transcript_16784/m.38877 type:complete len:493 (-) Transcript_16784:128-1606(-)